MYNRNWYTTFLLEQVIEKKRQLAYFNSLSEKYPTASEVAYGLSQEIRQLIADVVERKKIQK